MAYSVEYRIAWTALAASINLLHTMVRRGVADRDDVDAFADTITSILENCEDGVSEAPDEMSAMVGRQMDALLSRIRSEAKHRA